MTVTVTVTKIAFQLPEDNVESDKKTPRGNVDALPDSVVTDSHGTPPLSLLEVR